MLNYHHEPTNTRIEATDGTTTTSGHPYHEVHVVTPYVSTRVTQYESINGWTAQSIHLHASDPSARVFEPGEDRDPYVVVNIGTHDNIFVPMSIATAIVDAIKQKKFDDDEALCAAVK